MTNPGTFRAAYVSGAFIPRPDAVTAMAVLFERTEAISYKIPAFKRGGTFIYFAAFKKHVGIYPPVKGDARLAKALLPYRGDKGNLKFPLNQPMPYDLIGHVASALSREYSKSK